VIDSPPADEARRQAQHILTQVRFRGGALPHPFAGVLRTLGRWLRPVGHPLVKAYGAVVGNTGWRWAAVAIAAVLGAAGATYVVRRRSRTTPSPLPMQRQEEDVVTRLEAEADQAERDGEWALAYRLRFRAGLCRLEGRGLPRPTDTMTSRQLVAAVGSSEFAVLADELQQIVYAGRPASPDLIEDARVRWAAVLGAGKHR
jgi:hypothetical protein